jgi:hypothetical protein
VATGERCKFQCHGQQYYVVSEHRQRQSALSKHQRYRVFPGAQCPL